jgi:hypothetical protein
LGLAPLVVGGGDGVEAAEEEVDGTGGDGGGENCEPIGASKVDGDDDVELGEETGEADSDTGEVGGETAEVAAIGIVWKGERESVSVERDERGGEGKSQ